jgi:serine/threonine protein kinase
MPQSQKGVTLVAEKFGRYMIIKEMGRGGMATVYLAHDPRFGRDVALKVMSLALRDEPSFRGRFEREARTIAALEHPAIVPVYDFGEDHEQLFLVMRHMPGGSLSERIMAGPQRLADAYVIVARIGSALDHAHSQGVIHRDLKPANILFDQYGLPFLSDFGIVKLAEASGNITGSGVIGTPAYMSPEQVHGEGAIDGRSDIYSLAVILFETVTGRKPYRADTPARQMMAHILNPIPSILATRPDLPAEYETIMQKALAKEPVNRYADAQELIAALTATLPAEMLLTSGNLSVWSPPPLPMPIAAVDVDHDSVTESLVAAPLKEAAPPLPAAVAPPPDATDSLTQATRQAAAVDSWPPLSPGRTYRRRWLWPVAGLALLLAVTFLLISLKNGHEIAPTLTATTTTSQSLALITGPAPRATATASQTATTSPAPTPTATGLPLTPTLRPTPPVLMMPIGRSILGKPIEAARFGAGSQVIMLIGGIHAGFAPGTVRLAEEVINHFTLNPNQIPAQVMLLVIPSLNVDSSLSPGKIDGRLNARGVDLNRNWDCRWQQEARVGNLPVDGGEAPFSEPEVRALRDFILEHKPAAVVFWQAKVTQGLVSAGSCEEASQVSQSLAVLYGRAARYPVSDFERLVNQNITGDSTNWLDAEGIPAITVLLTDFEVTDWEQNLAGIMALLNYYGAIEP